MVALTADHLLAAYAAGVFPMAETRADPDVFWVDPRRRGIIPLGGFHISRSLARTLRRERFRATADAAFDAVVAGCAAREETWINPVIQRLYGELHGLGHAHSLEVWEGTRLAGGVYGVALGGAFFGESMFSRAADASKVALAHLVDRLRRGGFTLFDTQFLTPHLASLGAIEISRGEYRRRLAKALEVQADWTRAGPPGPGQALVQRSAQTS
ncbi:leucyl/phenylalanyl-tRNA--protein transferase [Wenxinia marina]|uniref:Leucyl/phenylalanyl-tRNA--protein transferase n=1 Tax=Wenxinia marina DSM 24838 TaxID=1123501 RepID=A0A0D0NKI2_9RHOB|nr:leucyl/phenylalanyl-tRNA--protein transferase [Wenxinia marina DSM 24838]GGL64949.1 leucyl/phenylalanyl-tRNA--protein transferase [Wenxinia marina]